VTSSDGRIVNASINGDTLLVGGVGQGSATLNIRDKNAGTITISVTVGTPLALSMTSAQFYVGDTVKVQITGGTPPYRVSALDVAIDAKVVGSELTVTGKAVGGPFDVTVIDALDQTVKFNVTQILAGSPQFNLAPATMTVAESSTQPLTFNIIGGTAPYTVRSTVPEVLAASISGSTVTVTTGSRGSRCVLADTPVEIQVNDARGGFATATVTVKHDPTVCPPLSLSMTSVQTFVGDTVRAFIVGGVPPYRLSVLDVAIDGSINGNQLTLLMKAVGGPFDVNVYDALNQTAKLTVQKISAGSPQFNLAPATVQVSENSTTPIALNIIGGTGPYTVRSSDTTLLQASVSGTTVNLTTGTKGNRCVAGNQNVTIEVQDAKGGFATSTVTIVDNPAGCGLVLSSNAVTVQRGGTVQVNILSKSPSGAISLSATPTGVISATESGGLITISSTPATTSTTATLTVIDAGPPAGNATINVTVVD
jgi:hypothetical protein